MDAWRWRTARANGSPAKRRAPTCSTACAQQCGADRRRDGARRRSAARRARSAIELLGRQPLRVVLDRARGCASSAHSAGARRDVGVRGRPTKRSQARALQQAGAERGRCDLALRRTSRSAERARAARPHSSATTCWSRPAATLAAHFCSSGWLTSCSSTSRRNCWVQGAKPSALLARLTYAHRRRRPAFDTLRFGTERIGADIKLRPAPLGVICSLASCRTSANSGAIDSRAVAILSCCIGVSTAQSRRRRDRRQHLRRRRVPHGDALTAMPLRPMFPSKPCA